MNQSFGDGDDENITVINGGPDTPLLISYQVSRVTTVISRPFGENGFDLNKLCVCAFSIKNSTSRYKYKSEENRGFNCGLFIETRRFLKKTANGTHKQNKS